VPERGSDLDLANGFTRILVKSPNNPPRHFRMGLHAGEVKFGLKGKVQEIVVKEGG